MSTEDGKKLEERLKHIPLTGGDAAELLRRLYAGLAEGGARARLLTAQALYAAADTAPEGERRRLVDAMLPCLFRSLEDYAMLCLMGWDENRHPLDIYLNLERPELRAFYVRVRKGLGEEMLFKLCGVASWDVVKKLPAFKGVDLSSSESALDWAARDAREWLERFSRLYHATPGEADPLLGPWQLAWSRGGLGSRLLAGSEDEPTELLISAEPGEATPSLALLDVNPDSSLAERVLREIEDAAGQVARLAGRRLGMLEDPTAAARGAQAEWMKHLEGLRAARLAQGQPEAAAPAAAAAAAPPAPAPAAPAAAEPAKEPGAPAGEAGEVKKVGGLKIIHSQTMKSE